MEENMNFKQVSIKEFYSTVRNLNVHPSIQPGRWPYTSLWKLSNGAIIGKTVGRNNPPIGEPLYEYFLKY